MKKQKFHHRILSAAILMAAICLFPVLIPTAQAQSSNWAADDDAVESRKIERYQQIVDQSPEKSYAFQQLMNTVGKGSAYQNLIATYEQKVKQKPKNFNLNMVLGHIYQYGGRTADAIRSYRNALEIKETPLVYLSIAAAEAENKNFEQAVQSYEAALNLSPSKEQRQDIWRSLAEISLYRRDMERAKVCFAELIKIEPNSLFIRRELAQIYAQNRLYEDARNVLLESQKLSSLSSSDKDQIELEIARLYEQEGADDEALARYDALSQRLGANHWMQREIIGHQVDIHRRQGTLAGLAQSLEKSWKSPSYTQHLELADLYDESRQSEAALDHIQKAIAQSPKSPEAREKLIQYYRSHGMNAEMIQARKDLIKAVPDNPDYRFQLYEIWIQEKKIDEAMALLDEMTKKFSNDFEVLHEVAEHFLENGRRSKARDIYVNWVKKHPRDIEALEALGNYYFDNDEKKEALSTWASIEKIPMDKQLKNETLARIYEEHGYFLEAESLYANAVSADAKDCEARSKYAEMLTRNKEKERALKAWLDLGKVCPNDATQSVAAKQISAFYRTSPKTVDFLKNRCEQDSNDLSARKIFFMASLAAGSNKGLEESEKLLKAYLARHPGDEAAIYALSANQRALGNDEEARSTLTSLLDKNESARYGALVALAEQDADSGNLETAQKELSEALALNASDAEIHEKLGDILVKRHQYEDALHTYETASQIDNQNFDVAFKAATLHSILGNDSEADALYIQIATKGSDETLMTRAAQRVIDDYAWKGTLDELVKVFMPLTRSRLHKTLYLDILLQIADAQAQPHILTLRTMDARQANTARHELKSLSETYSSVLVESLLANDVSLYERALALSAWIASSSVIQILGQQIESAPVSEIGRETQETALIVLAHAQSPIAIPTLKSCIESKNPRRLREIAIWALGLISTPQAMDELVKLTSSSIDSFRALAVIGLGRHGVHLDTIHSMIEDPSPLVQSAIFWALAHNRDSSMTQIIDEKIKGFWTTPNELWALSRLNARDTSTNILTQLWCGKPQNRAMSIRVMRTSSSEAVPDLSQMTRAEMLDQFIVKNNSEYATGFNVEALLDEFAQIETADYTESTAGNWLNSHTDGFIEMVSAVAGETQRYSLGGDCRLQMLSDLVGDNEETGLTRSDPAQKPLFEQTAQILEPYLVKWVESSDNQLLSQLSLRAGAVFQSATLLSTAIKTAKSSDSLAARIKAADAIAIYSNEQAQSALRELAGDSHYLVRATALSHLDPALPQNKSLLEKATGDSILIVSETAKKQLAGQ